MSPRRFAREKYARERLIPASLPVIWLVCGYRSSGDRIAV
jgi:hypothetical protein